MCVSECIWFAHSCICYWCPGVRRDCVWLDYTHWKRNKKKIRLSIGCLFQYRIRAKVAADALRYNAICTVNCHACEHWVFRRFPNRIFQIKPTTIDSYWIFYAIFFRFLFTKTYVFCFVTYSKCLLRPIFVGCDVTNRMNRNRPQKKSWSRGLFFEKNYVPFPLFWRHCGVSFRLFGLINVFELHTFQWNNDFPVIDRFLSGVCV